VNYEDAPDAHPTATRLLVHGDVGLGELRVQNNREELYFGDNGGPFHDEGPDLGTARSAACVSG
jgi:hypothetical protein